MFFFIIKLPGNIGNITMIDAGRQIVLWPTNFVIWPASEKVCPPLGYDNYLCSGLLHVMTYLLLPDE